MKGKEEPIMEREFAFNDELFDEELDEELDGQNNNLRDVNFALTETDFYPPSDNRVWKSNIEDIDGGDNFADYCQYIFRLYEDEGYYDN